MGEIANNIQPYEIQAELNLNEVTEQLKRMKHIVPRIQKFSTIARISSTELGDDHARERIKKIGDKMQSMEVLLQRVKGSHQKRSLMIAAGLVTVGAYFASNIFSHYNNVDPKMRHFIDITTAKLEENSYRLRYLNATIEGWTNRYASLEQEVKKVETIQRLLIFVTELNSMLDLLLMEVSDLEDGVIDGLHHRMSPKLIPPTMVYQVLHKLHKNLPAHMELAVTQDQIAEFYGLPFQILIDQDRIIFKTHIPAYKPISILSLYHHIPTPLWSAKNDVVLFLSAKKPFLVMNQDKTLHRELSLEELADCQKIGTLYLCPHLRILYKGQKSCLKALFLNDVSTAHKQCDVTVGLQENSMGMELSNNTYQVITSRKEQANQQCQTQRSDFLLQPGINQVYLPPGCILSTPSMFITTSPHPINSSLVQLHPFTTPHIGNLTLLLKHRHPGKDITVNDLLNTLKHQSGNIHHISLTELVNAAENAKRQILVSGALLVYQ
jgi:hypothetical protein